MLSSISYRVKRLTKRHLKHGCHGIIQPRVPSCLVNKQFSNLQGLLVCFPNCGMENPSDIY